MSAGSPSGPTRKRPTTRRSACVRTTSSSRTSRRRRTWRRQRSRSPATKRAALERAAPLDLLRANGRSGVRRCGLLDAAGKERLTRDHEPLDLGGALVQLEDLGVTHQLFARLLLDEAVAAVDLDGVRRDLHRGVRGEALRVG